MENQLVVKLGPWLTENYGFKNIRDIKVIQETDYNLVVFFLAENQKMIARISKIISPAEVKEETSALDYLYNKKLAVPKIIPAKNGSFVTCPDFAQTITVFEFIDGRQVESNLSNKPTRGEASSAARTLAQIHSASKGLSQLKRINRSVSSEIEKCLKNNELIENTYIEGGKFIEEIKVAAEKAHRFTNNFCLVHGDFRSKNLIFEKKTEKIKAVIDFEWCFLGPALYDLGLMLVEWSCPDQQQFFDQEMLETILQTYSNEAGKQYSLNEEIKFWMYYSALCDAATYLWRKATYHNSSEKIHLNSFMYQKASSVKNL
ncbi:MAG: phosphotransferase [Candidatus Paceibacterota bacterium]|jgi:Ser/Thr protein kinase RdoA (MazF antagonist)